MIYSDSRYADGVVFNAWSPIKDSYQVTVYRKFPSSSTRFSIYQWKDEDRIESVAAKFLGSGASWWRIMDYNPEVINPLDIPVGTRLRIPQNV